MKCISKSESVPVSFSVSNLNSASGIYAYVSNGVLIISGYLNSTVDIPSDTAIAQVTAPIKAESFASSIGSGNDIVGTRLVVRTNGKIVIERQILSSHWYSFTIVAFTN